MSEAQKQATYQDLLDLPETMTGEIIDGELVAMTRPRPKHVYSQGRLHSRIGDPFGFDEEPGGWWILIEPLVALSETRLVVPDLAGWRRERMPALPDEPRIEVPPDWVCEILSPSTMRHDRVVKSTLYLEHGVSWMWLVDLDAHILDIFEATHKGWLRLGSWEPQQHEARLPPFEAIPIDVEGLFPP